MSFYDNILGVLLPMTGEPPKRRGFGDAPPDDGAPGASPPDEIPAAIPAGGPVQDRAAGEDAGADGLSSAAPQSPGGVPDHDAVLHDALRAAGAPPHYLDSGHLVGAANLMAKEGLAPADAYERIVMQAARDGRLVDDDDFHHAFGDGASGEARTDEHRRMSRRLRRKAQTRTAARRQETLKLARAFLALAKLHAIPKLSARRIAGAKPHRSSASPTEAE